MKKFYCLIIAVAGLSACNFNTAKPTSATANSQSATTKSNLAIKTPAEIEQQLKAQLPKLPKIDLISDSPISGIYQVNVGREIFYITKDGQSLVFGNIIDPVTQANLTQLARDKLNTIDWNKLPLNLAIKEVNGNGKRKLAVFTDPECPYCKQFEQTIAAKLKDTTIYSFLFPLAELHPHAEQYSKQIWCSHDRATTFTNWMRYQKPLPALPATKCNVDGLSQIKDIGNNLVQVSGTPTFVLSNGRIIVGLTSEDSLNAAMDEADKQAK